jgi:hypothetical protein
MPPGRTSALKQCTDCCRRGSTGLRGLETGSEDWHVLCFSTLGGAPHTGHDDSGFSAQVRPRSQRRLTPSFVVAALSVRGGSTSHVFYCFIGRNRLRRFRRAKSTCCFLHAGKKRGFCRRKAGRLTPGRLAVIGLNRLRPSPRGYTLLQIDSRDFKTLAKVADVPGHPSARSVAVARIQRLTEFALCGDDTRACLWNVVDHYSQ